MTLQVAKFNTKPNPDGPMTTPPEPIDTFSLLAARPDDPPNIRFLRFVVIGMSAILILGFGAVIVRIVHLTTRQSPAEIAASQSSQPAQAFPTQAFPARIGGPLNIPLPLPAGAKVLSQSMSGNRLSVHYAAGGEEAIAVVDLDTGQLAASLAIPSAKK